jgi:hypothetical protein
VSFAWSELVVPARLASWPGFLRLYFRPAISYKSSNSGFGFYLGGSLERIFIVMLRSPSGERSRNLILVTQRTDLFCLGYQDK